MKDKSYDYQKTLTAQVIAEFDANRTDVVLAAACGAGKTFMAISLCEELLQKYPSLRILVLTHGQVNLRNQFVADIEEQTPNFTHIEIIKRSNLDEKRQVYIGLPQTSIPYWDSEEPGENTGWKIRGNTSQIREPLGILILCGLSLVQIFPNYRSPIQEAVYVESSLSLLWGRKAIQESGILQSSSGS